MADETVIDRLAVEIAKTGEFGRGPRLASIASPTATIESLLATVKALKAIVDAREGLSGSVLDKAMTMRDLIDAGAMEITLGHAKMGGFGSGAIKFAAPEIDFTQTIGYVDPRPYLSTPPAVTDFVVVGGFSSVFLKWSLVDYKNHSYVQIWRSVTDSIGAATAIGVSKSNQYVDMSPAISQPYYYWARAVGFDLVNEPVYGPYNAVGGTLAGRLMINGVDLAPLLIEAEHLADGSVQANKILDGAMTKTKFANGIEPVTIVNGVPLTLVTQTIYDSVTTKMYRWDGAAYTASVAGADIVANSITAGKIAVGAIGADQIAANAVSAGKIAANAVVAGTIAANAIVSGTSIIGVAAIESGMVNTLSAEKITFGTMSGDRITSNTLHANKITAGTLDATQIATGLLAAGRIDTRGLMISDGSGNIILQAGSAIDWTRLGGGQTNLTAAGYVGSLSATSNVMTQGVFASRPAGATGDFYYATDQSILYQKIGGSWVVTANNYNNTNQITDGAGLGSKADWPQIIGTGKPADGATKNTVTQGASAPGSPTHGDIWIDTVAPVTVKTYISGQWVSGGTVGATTAQVATISSKLNKSAADIITGDLQLASNAALYVGNQTTGIYYGANGLFGKNGGTTTFSITAGGAATFAGELSAVTGNFGVVTIGTGGRISQGMTTPTDGNGFWLGYHSSVMKFAVGNSATGKYLLWDGTDLIISGTLAATAVNAVNTINIAGEAVTIPRVAEGNFSASVSAISVTESTKFVLILTFTQRPGRAWTHVHIKQNGVSLGSEAPDEGTTGAMTKVVTVGAGTYTFSADTTNTTPFDCGMTLTVLGAKR